jgi:predicted  nucleic acid-binding Zn-ribbon protein
MTAVREAWTDERLDDLTKHMDENFREVRADIREMRGDLRGLREEITVESTSRQKEFAEVKSQVTKIDVRIDELARTMQIGFWLIGSFLVGLMGMFATQL